MQVNKVNPSFTGIVQVGQKIGDEAIKQTGLIDDVCSLLSPRKSNMVEVLAKKLEADIAVIPSENEKNVSIKIIHSTDYGDFFAKGKDGKEITTEISTDLSKESNFTKIKGFIKALKNYIQEPNTEFINKQTDTFHSEWAKEANKVDAALERKEINQKTYYDKLFAINQHREFAKDTIYKTGADF